MKFNLCDFYIILENKPHYNFMIHIIFYIFTTK